MVCHMLYLMVRGMTSIKCPVRVFVTSRPEVHIEDAFQSLEFSSSAQYFNAALAKLPEATRALLFISYPDATEDLTDLASGIFIYATTAIEFLLRFRRADIVRGMDQLRATSTKASLSRLDNLYTVVLTTAFPAEVLSDKLRCVRTVLGCIAVLQDHISLRAISVLTGLNMNKDLIPIIERLGAVISFSIDYPDVPIRPLHSSFGEFLVDPSCWICLRLC
ncbi:hypothetical protein AURDEDRAFT_174068 [Auricularia subglabra TFB-10046 SS5]|nr:hypothetical protein AURDEDRAFT_174068 [Auricularia subglabra TFB-10046 SS5]